MKRNFRLISAVFAIVICLSSCKKAIEETVYTSVSNHKIYSSEAGAAAVLASAYEPFNSSVYYGGYMLELKCAASTYFYNNQLRSAGAVQYHDFSLNSAAPYISNCWQYSYRVIARANDVIYNVQKATFNEDAKKRILGEAYFLRAFVFFDNYVLWGGIPLRTEPPSPENLNMPRASEAEVVKQIIADLDLAKANMAEPAQAVAGRPNKYAANALAMKLYIKLAGNDQSSPYWQKAIDEGLVIYNAQPYKLVFPYVDLWDAAKQPASKETIFEIQFSESQPGGRSPGYNFTPSSSVLSGGVSTSERIAVNKETFDYHTAQYPTDPRIDASYVHTSYLKGTTVTKIYPDVTLNPAVSGRYWPYVKKYTGKVTGNSSSGNLILLRYADVLLMLAEAENEVRGPQGAYKYVNEVLKRARYLTATTNATTPDDWRDMTQSQFRQRIMDERRYELMGELHEYLDVRRRGIEYFRAAAIGHNTHPANVKMMVGNPPPYEYIIPTDDATLKRGMLMPIPNTEMSSNSLITIKDQNPGY
jgi:hypothetical protein